MFLIPCTATTMGPRSVSTVSSTAVESSLDMDLATGNWSWMFFSSMSSILSEGIVLKTTQDMEPLWQLPKRTFDWLVALDFVLFHLLKASCQFQEFWHVLIKQVSYDTLNILVIAFCLHKHHKNLQNYKVTFPCMEYVSITKK